MKRLFVSIIAGLLMVWLVGCGNANETQPENEQTAPAPTAPSPTAPAPTPADPTTPTEDAEPESEYPFPQNATPTGAGKVSVQTPSGDSATGTTPVLIVPEDTMMDQVGYTLEGFDGSREVFLYINRVFVEAQQAGEMFQSSFNLEGELLQPGDYTVSAIQFEGNDPTSGKVTHYHETKYTVKQGS